MAQPIQYVAQFFLSRGEHITHLKLQKLCFYAQAWHVAKTATPLVSGDFEAWKRGPVHPELYQRLKQFGDRPIHADVFESNFRVYDHFEDEEAGTLFDVWNLYGHKQANELVEETHQEEPWRNHYIAGHNNTIPVSDIQAYYRVKYADCLSAMERLLEELQEQVEEDFRNGLITIGEPSQEMIEQWEENHELFKHLAAQSLTMYLEGDGQ